MPSAREAVDHFGQDRTRARHRAPATRGRAGRHRTPEPPPFAGKTLRTTGVTAALVGGGLGLSALPASAATANDFARLRTCESGNNYATNTGNGFYGAYQFDAGTWHGLGYPGLPSDGSPATQDEAAYRLYNARGWQPWPSCSAKLGLGNGGPAPSTPAPSPQPAPVIKAQQVARHPALPPPSPPPPKIPVGPAPYGGTILSTKYADQVRTDTLRWQARMRTSRFMLTLDGRFGPQSAGVATLYSYLSGVRDGRFGVVGPRLWRATVDQPSGP